MKAYRKLISAAVAAVLFVSVFARGAAVNADNAMTAAQQVAAINVGWNLGNTLDAYGTWIDNVSPQSVETCWGNPVTTRQMIAAVRERGFNTIRIPVTWAQFMDAEGNVDQAWMDRVREVVDWSLDEGLYVILNVHHDTGEHGSDKVCWLIADTGTYDSVRGRFENLWQQIAEEFKDYDNRLMFEGYNEMLDMNNTWNAPSTGSTAYDAVNSFAQLFVDTVRAAGSNNATRNLIVNTYVASADPAVLNAFTVPTDNVADHLICEVHAYTPWQFCATEGDASYTSFDDNCRSQIDGLMSSLSSFSSSHGIPVIIGEFGVQDKNNDADRASYAAYYVQKAGEYGIRCIWWDNGIFDYGGFGIFDRNALSWNEDITSALIDNAPSGTAAPAGTGETSEPAETETSEPAESTSSSAYETSAAETASVPSAAACARSDTSSESRGASALSRNALSFFIRLARIAVLMFAQATVSSPYIRRISLSDLLPASRIRSNAARSIRMSESWPSPVCSRTSSASLATGAISSGRAAKS